MYGIVTVLCSLTLTFAAQKMKYLLHINTSGDGGCIAIAGDGKLICEVVNNEARNHAASINIMIDAMLNKAGITLNDLSAVVVCNGPGSYTGLRISLATAKGLCYALDIPLILDNKLTLLAYQAFKKYKQQYNFYIPRLPARENEYFMSVFDGTFAELAPARHVLRSEFDDLVAEKDKICLITPEIDDESHQKYAEKVHVEANVNIDLILWAFYAFEEFKCNSSVNLSTAEPFYLKQVYTHK